MDVKKFIITSWAVCSISFVLTVCASNHRELVGNAWADATLIAEQSAIIEQQRRTLDDMGVSIARIRLDLESARADIDTALGQAKDIRDIFTIVDWFVRTVIDAERQLEELQSADRGADAGAR